MKIDMNYKYISFIGIFAFIISSCKNDDISIIDDSDSDKINFSCSILKDNNITK